MGKIALFAGAFDPPHLGHSQIIDALDKTRDFESIILAPTGDREDKRYHSVKSERKEMIKIWKKTLENTVKGSTLMLDFDIFEGKVGEGTYDHDAYFKVKYHIIELYHIFGSDTLGSMPFWEPHGEAVAQSLRKYIFYREGFPPDFSGIENYTYLDTPSIPNISSTEVRAGKSDYLHPKISAYILKNGLYGYKS